MPDHAPKIILSESDYRHLSALVSHYKTEAVSRLEEELARAQVLPNEEVPSDVISLHSTVKVKDTDTGIEQEYELVMPHEADIDHNKISILAPLGVALVGLRVGDEYEWETPNHRLKYFEVLATRRASATATTTSKNAAGK